MSFRSSLADLTTLGITLGELGSYPQTLPIWQSYSFFSNPM